MPEGNDREIGRAAHGLEVGIPRELRVQQLRLAEIPLDRGADRIDPMHPKGHPELQGTEGARILERDVDHVRAEAVMRDVRLLVRERGLEIAAVAGENDPARLREVHPLVRVDAERVGPVEPGEEVADRGTVAAAPPYAPSTCSQTLRGSQTSAIALSGSTAPVSVVPVVATTAIGTMPRRYPRRSHRRPLPGAAAGARRLAAA